MTPGILSIEFHAHFFPALLRNRLRPVKKAMAGFLPPIFEYMIAVFVCVMLLIFGIPGALRNSLAGWVLSSLGALGIVALLINSIVSREDPPSYDDFLLGVFFFFVLLGVTAGIFAGALNHSLVLGFLVSAGGLFAGYLLGILAGFYLQYLGWMSLLLNFLSGLGVLGMLIVDIVLLSGVLSG